MDEDKDLIVSETYKTKDLKTFMDCVKMDNKAIVFVAALMVGCLTWQVYSQVTCNATGRFPVDGSNCQNYTYCVLSASNNSFFAYNYVCPTTSLFNPTSQQCTTSYTCTDNTTTTTETNTTTSVCTADGFVANPNVTDCSSYIQCVSIDGVYTETVISCPSGTYYNPTTTFCDSTYVCTTTFTCTTAGRFADTTDTTCQNYFYCVLDSSGAFTQLNYTCPSTSVFDPTTAVCTTNYTCTN